MARLTKAQLRGIYPEGQSFGHLSPTLPVTVRLSTELLTWLKGYVGRNSFTFCVEEAITTGLRVMKGELNVGTLLSVMASNDGASLVEAMHGKLNDRLREEIGNLMHAAYIIQEFEHFPHLTIRHLDAINADNRATLVKAWRAVAPE